MTHQEKLWLIKMGQHPKECVPKPKKPIKKKSTKKLIEERNNKTPGDSELLKWYKSVQKQLKGTCMMCGSPYNKNILQYAIPCIAHILPKRSNQFPSVATHSLNWLELGAICGCHYKFDNLMSWEDKKNSILFPLIMERLTMIEPNLSQNEKNKIPDFIINKL